MHGEVSLNNDGTFSLHVQYNNRLRKELLTVPTHKYKDGQWMFSHTVRSQVMDILQQYGIEVEIKQGQVTLPAPVRDAFVSPKLDSIVTPKLSDAESPPGLGL